MEEIRELINNEVAKYTGGGTFKKNSRNIITVDSNGFEHGFGN